MNFMLKNRNGSITIMLVAILISALFLNNTFIEIGRYKALNNIYGEIQENAAFSVLANYDRDLFGKYGLLAIDEEVGENKFLEYLQADISTIDGDKLDLYFNASDIQTNFEKLYFLSQKDVFETQVNEFCEYRAPIALVNNTFEIQEVLEALIEELEKSLSFLEVVKSHTELSNKALEAYDKLEDYEEQLEQYSNDIEKYKTAYDEYTNAVDEAKSKYDELSEQEAERERRLSEIDAGNIPEVDWTPYFNACSLAAGKAGNLQGKIDMVKQSMLDYWEKYSAFKDAFVEMESAEISATLKTEGLDKDLSDVVEEMQKSYDNSEDLLNDVKTLSSIFDYDYFMSLYEDLEQDKVNLKSNQDRLNVQTKGNIALASVGDKCFRLRLKGNLTIIDEIILQSLAGAERLVDENSAMINDLIKLAELYVDLSNSGMGSYNTKCTSHIDSGTVERVELLSNNVENSFAESDKVHVDVLVNDEKAQMVAAELGYRTTALGSNDRYAELTQLEMALQEFSNSADKLNDAFTKLKESGLKLRQLIKSLLNIVVTVVEFLNSAINAVKLMITCATSELSKIIYSKSFAATYATEMFTNRSSDVNSDKRMNGSSYTNYLGISNDEVFVQANAEYVFKGNLSEEINQECAFLAIMGFRLLANLPAVFKDATIKSFIEMTAAIPYVGPVLSVLLFLVVLGMESYLDMIFMIYGDDGVYIVKKKLYLSVDGSDELASQIDGILGNVSAALDDAQKKPNKKSLSDKIDDWSDGLFRWDYKQHLFLALCLFVSTDKMYAREADLVQMQMDKDRIDKEFRLNKMATYVRTDTTVRYTPMLPVPINKGIPIRKMYYTGY